MSDLIERQKAIEAIKNKKLNCPNCGAPITGDRCEYCGTLFYDFANIEIGEIGYFRMKIYDNLFIFRARVNNIEITKTYEPVSCYADNVIIETISQSMPEINLSLSIVEDDMGIILEKRNKKLMEEARKR